MKNLLNKRKLFIFFLVLNLSIFLDSSGFCLDKTIMDKVQEQCKNWEVYKFVTPEYCVAEKYGELSTQKQESLVDDSVNNAKEQILACKTNIPFKDWAFCFNRSLSDTPAGPPVCYLTVIPCIDNIVSGIASNVSGCLEVYPDNDFSRPYLIDCQNAASAIIKDKIISVFMQSTSSEEQGEINKFNFYHTRFIPLGRLSRIQSIAQISTNPVGILFLILLGCYLLWFFFKAYL